MTVLTLVPEVSAPENNKEYPKCKVCGANITVGAEVNESGKLEAPYPYCVQHLFEKVIFPEEESEGRRFTRKKAIGEPLL